MDPQAPRYRSAPPQIPPRAPLQVQSFVAGLQRSKDTLDGMLTDYGMSVARLRRFLDLRGDSSAALSSIRLCQPV